MTSEFQALYSLFLKPDYVQMEAIDFLTGKEKQPPKSWQELGEVTDPSARLSLLTQAVITAYKDYSRVGRRRDAGLLEALGRLEQHYIRQYDDFISPLCLNPVIPDISMFPEGSWALSFKFKLKKPYMSKDDSDFYIIDNPIRKEWVFKLPYIAASQWKGALRAAMVKKLVNRAKYEFNWDEIPGNNSERLIDFIKKYYGIGLAKTGKIEKTNDNETIRIIDGNNSISIYLSEDKTKMNLKIDDNRTSEFIARKVNDNCSIYVMSDEEFARKRFFLTLLFGDEKGEEESKGLAKYLDNIKLSCIDWNEIHENYREQFVEFLKQNYGIDWISSASIQRLEEGKTIKFSHEKHTVTLRLDNDSSKAVLINDNKKICDFPLKLDNEKIYLIIPYAASLYRNEIRMFIQNEATLSQHSGCLYFYPTYFTGIGLEVINPHIRKTGAGDQPIYFECVPAGKEGRFVMTCVPLYGKNAAVMEKNVIECLQQVAEGIEALMTRYGSGAKTSGGFGLAEEQVGGGRLVFNIRGIEEEMHDGEPDIEIPQEFSKYLNDDGTVKERYRGRGEEGLLSRKEFGEKKQTEGWNFSEFMKFRGWFKVHGKMLGKKSNLECSDALFGIEFESFEDFKEKVNHLANCQNTGEI
jgi:CRISPR/Cas system CMR subunit Cmr6 (Cas7 group RAMP superfamily)